MTSPPISRYDLERNTPVLQPVYVRLLCEVLQKKGLLVQATLQTAGIGDVTTLRQGAQALSVRQLIALVEAARSAGLDDRLALDVGALIQISAHGALGHAVVASRDLRQALTVVARFSEVRNLATRFVFRGGPHRGVLEVHERVDLGSARVFVLTILALTVGNLAQTVLSLPADESGIQEAALPFDQPAWGLQLAQNLGCPCGFASARLEFVWSAKALDKPNPMADGLAFANAVGQCEQELNVLNTVKMATKVMAYLGAQEPDWPTLAQTAGHFRMSTRSLMRHLHREGHRFQNLLDEQRSQRAQWYMAQTRLSVDEVALRLGYQDTSNFIRRFRRWFNRTPGQMRSQYLAQPDAVGR